MGRSEDIAGFRVVRQLATGTRSDVYLGASRARDGSAPVALKLFHPEAAGADIDVAILSNVQAPALPRLLDIASRRGRGPCLVVERLEGETIQRWAAAEAAHSAGELVTVLAPLLPTLAALHDANWSVGQLRAGSLRFDSSGRAVITSHAGAKRIDPGGREPYESLRADAGSFVELTRALVNALQLSDDGAVAAMEDIVATRHSMDLLAGLEEALFAWAAPQAVASVVDAGDSVGDAGAPESTDQVMPVSTRRGVRTVRSEERPAVNHEGTRLAEDEGRQASDRWAERLDGFSVGAAARSAAERLGTRRRPILIAGAAGVVLTIGALVMLPAGDSEADSGDAPSGSPTVAATTSADAAPTLTAELTQQTDAAPDATPVGVDADDPVDAARALVAARVSCLSTADPACLSAVDQAGSSLDEADRHSIMTASAAVSIPDPSTAKLVQRTGDVVILTADGAGPETEPASILMIRTEAGWRLRDVFVGD